MSAFQIQCAQAWGLLRRVSKLYLQGACVATRDNSFGKKLPTCNSAGSVNDQSEATCEAVFAKGRPLLQSAVLKLRQCKKSRPALCCIQVCSRYPPAHICQAAVATADLVRSYTSVIQAHESSSLQIGAWFHCFVKLMHWLLQISRYLSGGYQHSFRQIACRLDSN